MSWKTLFARRPTPRLRTTPRPPSLELLEDRVVPSANFFGAQAKVVTPFSGAQVDSAVSVLVQQDGKIVAAGNSGRSFALTRYQTNGALDATFGTSGRVVTPFPGDYTSVTAADLQADGKIVVAGNDYSTKTNVQAQVLVRYTKGGALDPSFGGGKVTVLQGTNGFGSYVAALPNGEIAVTGSIYDFNTSQTSFVVEEYTAAGTPDTSFGTNGRVTTVVGASGSVAGIALQGGNILVAGSTYDPVAATSVFVVARYTAGGALDTTFGVGGLGTSAAIGSGSASGIAVGPDGKVVVVGIVSTFTPTFSFSSVVGRFTVGGTFDAGFGVGGLAFTSSAIGVGTPGVAVQADGKVVVGSSAGDLVFARFAVTRFTAAGVLDGGFGSGGTATTPIGNVAAAHAVALQRDGKVVAAGFDFNPATGNDFALARYTPAGRQDAGFGQGGVVTTNFVGQVSAQANSVVEDEDGNTLVAGTTSSAGASLSLARYRRDGRLDDDFGNGGKVQVTFNPYIFGPAINDGFVAVQRDEKILLLGTSIEPGSTNYDFALARLLPDGRLDPRFGTGGKVTTFSGAKFTDMAPSGGVVIQPDGKILAAGYLENYGVYPYVDKGVVVRYNRDGSLDTSFGSGGRSVFDLPQGLDRVTALALGPDGKIVVGGFVTDQTTFNEFYFLERLQPNGAADGTFGTGGQVITNFSGYFFASGAPLAVRPDGKILVGGPTYDPVASRSYMTVAQFTAGGAVDAGYGVGGQASVGFGDPSASFVELGAMTLQPDGKVVVAGIYTVYDPTTFATISTSFAVARLTATGSLDTHFGTGGRVTTLFDGRVTAKAVLVRRDGGIVVVGGFVDPNALVSDYALAEYNPDGSLAWGHRHRH